MLTALVDELIRAGELERARRWCVQGHARTVGSAPGTAAVLQERLRAMARKERRYDLVAAYRAEDFFDSPSIARYGDMRKAAEQAKRPDLMLAGLYNVLEKLKAGEPLSAKEKDIHEKGLVSVLRTLHDEIDRAVLDAYGWSDLVPLIEVVNGNPAGRRSYVACPASGANLAGS